MNSMYTLHHRNQQKRAKTVRHEAEKAHMADRCGLGISTGQYQGGGQGDLSDGGEDEQWLSDIEDIDSGSETDTDPPLLFFFDIETTGLNIYNDAITEIAGKAIGISCSQPTYTSLVMTNKNIPKKGRQR